MRRVTDSEVFAPAAQEDSIVISAVTDFAGWLFFIAQSE
jgi:hypothetical protein